MKQYYILATIIILIISFGSCTNDIENPDIIPIDKGQKTGDNIIIQKRNPKLPLIKKFILSESQTRSSISSENGTFLGYSYKIQNGGYIQGCINSLGFPIIDIDSIRKYRPSDLQEKLIIATEMNIFTYNNLDKYMYDSRIGKKISSEFTFNPNVFTTGKKEAITRLFGNIEKATYGELEISFINGQSTLNHLSSSKIRYISQFQNHLFTQILYNVPMTSILNEFGEFILTDYFTGGKVHALFASKAKEGTTAQKKEVDMHASINASVINQNNASGINFGFNGSNFDVTTTFKGAETFLDMKTFGGGQNVAINTKVSNINIDLTPWRYSLKDMANNTMIDIADNSLYPLSAFVLEQNFKQRLDDTFNEILPANKELVPPRIEIVRVFARSTPSNEALYDVAAVLVTRQTDRIILSDGIASSATDEELKKNENNEVFMQKVEKIATEKSKLFSSDIEISYNKDTKLNPALKSPLCIELTGFNERNFYRFYNEKTNIEYIYDPATDLCLSYYINKGDDSILDIYGIRNWVESLPEKKISITTLVNSYKIIGL